MIREFNRTMDYIESVLCDEIDENKLARISGYSYAMFSRIFSILTGYSLSEYIRLRKLTLAAIEIKDKNKKIIDIALKYGYNSSDSFTLAFKKFHNHTPTQIKNGERFKIFSPIRLSIKISGGDSMNTRIEKKPAFKIAGIRKKATRGTEFSKVWDELFEIADIDDLKKLGDGVSYGACFEAKDCISFDYMAAFDLKNLDKAKELGLEIMDIPEADYAIVSLKGKVPNCIHEGWKYIMEVFFPENGYTHSGSPDFEVYKDGDMYSDDYEMELWIPVIKSVNN